jgi:hypothetical protein
LADGFYEIRPNNINNLPSLKSKAFGVRENVTKDFLSLNPEMENFGILDTFSMTIGLNKPIIISLHFSDALKFAKNISYINLSKNFLICAKRKTSPIHYLTTDVQLRIITLLLNYYIDYLPIIK